MKARTTLKDFGRASERHGQIPFFNVYPFRFYVNEHHIMPNDVFTWCQANCRGYYRVVCYRHRSSRDDKPVMFIDKVYLSDESDAALLKLHLDVTTLIVLRPEKAISKTPKGTVKPDKKPKSKTTLDKELSRRAKAAWETRRANGWVHPTKRSMPLLRLVK